MSLSPFAAVQTCRNSPLMVEARGRWHRGWAKGYFLSTTCRPLEYWSPSQRNKKPNIGWKGRECRIAIGQNTKREIPSCNENPTTLGGRCFAIEWAFNTFPRLETILLNLIATINFCKDVHHFDNNGHLLHHFHNGQLLPRDGNFRGVAAISDLHLPNLPQIASCGGLRGQWRNKYDFHSAHAFWPSWVLKIYLVCW